MKSKAKVEIMDNLTKSNFKILNNFFDKIIILTIERNAKRLEIIKQVLSGLDYEVFIGADGSKLDLKVMKENNQVADNIQEIFDQANIDYMNMAPYPIHINQVACALSHKKLYEYIYSNRLDKVLILEDDVIPVDKNLKFLSETLKQVPSNWEVLYLGHLYNNNFSFWGKLKYYYIPHLLYKAGIRKRFIIRKVKTYPVPFSTRLYRQGGHIGTHAYAVRGRAVNKLIELQTPLKLVAPDLLLMDAIAKNIVISYTSDNIFFEQNPKIHSSIWGK